MAAAENIVVLAVVGGVGAYVLNVGGFRDWLNTQITGGESETYTEGGGEFGEGDKKTTSTTATNPCTGGNVTWLDTNFGKCSNNLVCWSNVPCGGTKRVAVCGMGFTRDGIRNVWLSKYKCKTTVTKPTAGCGCPYTDCNKNVGKQTCLTCCCNRRCASMAAGRKMAPKVDNKGSCLCNFYTGTKPVEMVGNCTKTRFQQCASTCVQKYPGRKPVLSADCKLCYCRQTSAFATAFEGRITIG